MAKLESTPIGQLSDTEVSDKNTAIQLHWTPEAIAIRWGKHLSTVKQQLKKSRGVIWFGRGKTLRVPESVLLDIESRARKPLPDRLTRAMAVIEFGVNYKPRFRDVEPNDIIVYVVASGELVKIGCTAELPRRIQNLRNSSAIPVSLLVAMRGGRGLERQLHSIFQEARQHGEWFAFTPEIRQVVGEVKSRGLDISGVAD